ncbi:UNVERIFIED_CONTAM: hypothetical protein GTU68_051458 [Idotea baltica]|nr:hypothetical protein [Idotea baltica]
MHRNASRRSTVPTWRRGATSSRAPPTKLPSPALSRKACVRTPRRSCSRKRFGWRVVNAISSSMSAASLNRTSPSSPCRLDRMARSWPMVLSTAATTRRPLRRSNSSTPIECHSPPRKFERGTPISWLARRFRLSRKRGCAPGFLTIPESPVGSPSFARMASGRARAKVSKKCARAPLRSRWVVGMRELQPRPEFVPDPLAGASAGTEQAALGLPKNSERCTMPREWLGGQNSPSGPWNPALPDGAR